MQSTKKIATNIPKDLIDEATCLTGLNQTQALIEGLRQLIAGKKRQELLQLGGKLKINFNVGKARQRTKS